ncbi:MAG: sulfotransferase family protein [Porticoccaceae bacterium]
MNRWIEGQKVFQGKRIGGSKPPINYLCNLSNKYRYIYMETPKVGCSTIKKNLHWMELGEDHVSSVHDKSASPLFSPGDSEVNFKKSVKSYFKFSFVRNPYARALSCYLDKVRLGRKKRYSEMLGVSEEEAVSFEAFLTRVSHQKTSEMDLHWIPLSVILTLNNIEYDFVGRFENFENDLIKVIALVCERNNISTPDNGLYVARNSPHRTDASSLISEYMTERSGELIREIYRDDFELFGYSKTNIYG